MVYLDKRDFFFNGLENVLWLLNSLLVKFILQYLFLDLAQKYLKILRAGPGFSISVSFKKTFSLQ